MAAIEMKNIVKQYGDGFPAVNDVSIDVADGEFMILVGPSGCGKSTLLRMIVGLEDITSGDMMIGGKRVNDLAPRERNLAMVFQNYALFPIAWIVSVSFKNGATDIAAHQFLPNDPTWTNYKTVFKFPLFQHALVNSFVISLVATTISVFLATLCAYAIARLEFKGKKLVLTMALAIAMFPVVSLVGPLFDMWRAFGLYDTWPGLIIPYMSFTLPLAIWTLSAFFREIPWEMEQAAQVDGATSWQAFRKVIVPLAAPGVFTAAILTFFFAWNEFVLALSLTSTTASRTVPAQLSFFVGPDPFNPPYGLLATASVVVTVPIIIIVLLFQRKIVAGLTSGAVKG